MDGAAVYEDLQHKAAEVEKMIAKLEAMQKELADCQGAWPAGVEEEEEKWLEEEKDGLDAETSKQLQQEVRRQGRQRCGALCRAVGVDL